jgi:hypothetical protein
MSALVVSRTLFLAGSLSVLLMSQAGAGTIASSTFSTNADGWTDGDLTDTSAAPQTITYDSTHQWITSPDPELGVNNAFIAPSKFIGNDSSALNGTISFQLSDSANAGNNNQSPLSLISGSTVLYAKNTVGVPSTSQSSLTTYTITLSASDFYTGNSGDQTDPTNGTVTNTELATVLGSLTQLAIGLDWNVGDDFSTLDNVVLTAGPPSATPLPAALPLFAGGLGMIGFLSHRKKRKQGKLTAV